MKEPDGSAVSNIAYADDIIDRIELLAKHMVNYRESVLAAVNLIKASRNLMLSDLHDYERRNIECPRCGGRVQLNASTLVYPYHGSDKVIVCSNTGTVFNPETA